MREDRGTAPGARRGAHAGPPARSPRPGPWLRGLRPRTVRARIIALLMVPVVSVIALWGFATVTTAQGVWNLLRQRDAQRTVLTPVAETVAGLQAERTAAGQLLTASAAAPTATPTATPTAARESALREAAAATDRALTPLFPDARHPDRGYNRADAQGLGGDAAARLDALGGSLAALPVLRDRVLAGSVGWPEVYAAYGEAVDRALAAAGAVTPSLDRQVATDAGALVELARSRELLAREDALLRAAQVSGGLGDDQLREFSGVVFARREFERDAVAALRPADREALLAVTGGQDHRELAGYEDKVRAAVDGRAAVAGVPAGRWAMVAGNVAGGLRSVEDQAGRLAAERQDPYALGLFTPAGMAVLLGLVGVLASLVISVQIGRGLVTELIGLRNSALELAGRKLPEAMRKLRAGEEVDVEAEVSRPVERGDEIGQVHRALGTVQRAAVTAAVERAEVLSGVSGVFVNLARRSQVLVHRQLTLLDAMERRTEDPSELADLFRLDHLTTRMRRHAEGLIILSGAAPGRGWRRPVPLVDVVRAAVSEVEEYARVEVHPLPRTAVAGHAVADLTHLVAELVENATGFSPPHTRVHIRGEQVGNGFALEIEDRGLGMGPEMLDSANRRIAAAEQSGLFDSDRLGLFVVSRLARRQAVRVSLVTSAYGGTTAVVLLPTALLADGTTEAGPEDARHEPGDVRHDRGDVRHGFEPVSSGAAADPARPVVGAAQAGFARSEFAQAGFVEPEQRGGPEGEFTSGSGRPERPAEGPAGGARHGESSQGGADPGFPAAGGPPPEGGALLPFGVRGGAPGQPRRTPFRASTARTAGPAADGGEGVDGGAGAVIPARSGPPWPYGAEAYRTDPVPESAPAPAPGPGPAGGRADGHHPAGHRVGDHREGRGRPQDHRIDQGPEELPRRTRQASLVPQLREAPVRQAAHNRRTAAASAAASAGFGDGPGDGSGAADRSPEAARAAMSAFQNGWARGLNPEGRRDGQPIGPPQAPQARRHQPSSRPEGERP
ncbi:nitrate- and nitrite sensing domain-containing protein [Kitasatospora sp. NPDC056783]|uniref:nitrate- and nitrite sensing domain-containing protein n=1 Tax=Kitasatospora sp. NPDC056783 TaxID=3345943 RepID=UPI0036C6D56B